MPLSKKGNKVLSEFIKEYGKKKGKNIFYAWENKHKENKRWLIKGVKIKTKMARGMIPLVRLDCENSRKLARAINSPIIFVPLYDLLTDINAEPNELFEKIKFCGGIHKFLDYHGIVVLSLIMRDDLIWKSFPKNMLQL